MSEPEGRKASYDLKLYVPNITDVQYNGKKRTEKEKMKQMKQSAGNMVVTSALAALFFAAFANAGIVTRPFVSMEAKRRIRRIVAE